MNDEIKEILDYLKDEKWEYYPSYMLPYKVLVMEERDKLLDYITNLQQENERLKETNVYCNRTDCVGRIKDSRKYDSVYQEKEDYKSRCEKAIEYIKSNPNVFYDENLIDVETLLNNEFTDEYVGEIRFLSTLLNILQNGSEKDDK